MKNETWTKPEVVDTITHPNFGLVFEIFCTVKTFEHNGVTKEEKKYNFSNKRNLGRTHSESGNQLFSFRFFKKHIATMQSMLDEVQDRITRLELSDRFGPGGGIE